MPNGTCSLPECERKAYCRQMCRPHYEATKGYDRKPAVCTACGVDYMRHRKATTECCPSCAQKTPARLAAARANAIASAVEKRTIWPSCRVWFDTCPECGQVFTSQTKRLTCSSECAVERHARAAGCRDRSCRDCGAALGSLSLDSLCAACRGEAKRSSRRRAKAEGRKRGAPWATMRNHRQRARSYGVDYEPVNRLDIYERDAWRCGICCESVDKTLRFPDPMSASLDHVVPMYHGGAHVESNLQLAHFMCNSIKGADLLPGGIKSLST